MNDEPVLLSFANCSAKESNVYADSLAQVIKDFHPSIEVKRRRAHSDAQDFGATLAIVLGSASASAVAGGIAAWLKRNSGVRLIASGPDGHVIADNLDSRDASRIVEALAKGR